MSTGVVTGTAVAGVAGIAEIEFSGSKLALIKSFRTLSASIGEFVGRLNAGVGGESLSGAGRLLALPLGFAIPPIPDTVGDLGFLGEVWGREKATSTKKSGFRRCWAARRGREGRERTETEGLNVERGRIALQNGAGSSPSSKSAG